MPLHTPPERLEWNVQRYLNTPLRWKTRLVLVPVEMVVFFDQFAEYDVTVCGPQDTAFQVTRAPFATVAFDGDHVNVHVPRTVVEASAGNAWPTSSASTAAPTATLRTLANALATISSPVPSDPSCTPVYGRVGPPDCPDAPIRARKCCAFTKPGRARKHVWDACNRHVPGNNRA